MEVRIELYKKVVFMSLFHDIETWSTITPGEWKQLETWQHRILKGITEQRDKTPCFGLKAELGIWPVKNQIEYRKLMLLHRILHTKKDTLLKQIIRSQIQNTFSKAFYNGFNSAFQSKVQLPSVNGKRQS